MSGDLDLAIVGAGPAGLAAATLAAELGLSVTLFDEAPAPGGQIYRDIERATDGLKGILGDAYRQGAAIATAFRQSGAKYAPGSMVWQLTRDRRIGLACEGRVETVRARRILIATGAQERSMPIPGWTLPGVMMAGGAQALLKSSGLVPDAPVVLAGNGPLLYLLGAQLAAAGVPISAVLDTGTHYFAALRHLPAAMLAGDYLRKGFALIAAMRRAGVPIHRDVRKLRALGKDRLEAVEFDGRRLPASLLCLHQGVVTNAQLTLSIPLKHEWDAAQRCWRPVVDDWGNSDIDGIAVAGDCAGIAGAEAAYHAGRLAALEAARALGKISAADREARAAADRAALARHLRIRPFLDALYPPGEKFLSPPDEVLVCRCEEVTAGQVRQAAREGCAGPDQVKSLTRAGMGACQGRFCALTVTEIAARALSMPVAAMHAPHVRAPVKPLPVAQLMALE